MEDILNESEREYLEEVKEYLDKIKEHYLKFLADEEDTQNSELNAMHFVTYLKEHVINYNYKIIINANKEDKIKNLTMVKESIDALLFFKEFTDKITQSLFFDRSFYELLVEKYMFIPYLLDMLITENYELIHSLLNMEKLLDAKNESENKYYTDL